MRTKFSSFGALLPRSTRNSARYGDVNIASKREYKKTMGDKKIMVFIFSALVGTSAYQLLSSDHTAVLEDNKITQPLSTAYGPSLAVVDCQECLEVTPDSCDIQTDQCFESESCGDWLSCTEDCVTLNADQSCYDDCDVSHSDSHSVCSSMKSCMCDVCVGQCVDMCMADG